MPRAKKSEKKKRDPIRLPPGAGRTANAPKSPSVPAGSRPARKKKRA